VKSLLNRLLEAFKDWLSRRLPDCREMTPTIGESLDRKLGWWEDLMMKLHLFTCDRCGRYLQQLGFLKKTLHHHGDAIADPETAGADLRKESKERLKSLLTLARQSQSSID
jgi:hypothetical protein